MLTKILDNIFPAAPAPQSEQLSSDGGPFGRFWPTLFTASNNSAAGVAVTPTSALGQATANACVRVLAETMAQLPVTLYERTRSGSRLVADRHMLAQVIGVAPNGWQSWFEWVELMQGHLALRGNAYSFIVGGERGAVSELRPIHPDRVEVARFENGAPAYVVSDGHGHKETYTQDEVFHLRGFSADGLTGLSPVAMARDTIGTALAAERYGAKFFSQGVRPSGILKLPAGTKPQDAAKAQETLIQKYSGESGWQQPLALWGNIEWQAVGMTNRDAEFLESMKRSDKEICKIWRMPPHMVGILDNATFSNIEQQSLEFVTYTMLPEVRRWEEAIYRQLVDDPSRYYVKFNLRGLLRGDNASRADYYARMVNNGLMSPNEIRELEDLDPYEGGDSFFMQGAMVSVDRILNPPEATDPQAQTAANSIGQTLARRLERHDDATTQPHAIEHQDAAQAARLRELEQTNAAAIRANGAILTAAVERVIRIERDRLATAAKKPNFLSAMEEVYADLTPKFVDAIALAIDQRATLGVETLAPETLVARHVERSKELLLNASECQPAELRAAIERCISTWQERAREFLT